MKYHYRIVFDANCSTSFDSDMEYVFDMAKPFITLIDDVKNTLTIVNTRNIMIIEQSIIE